MERDGYIGTGAVVGDDLVLTVKHVARDGRLAWVCGGRPAKVVASWEANGWNVIEEITLLKILGSPFDREDVFEIQPSGSSALSVWTLDGKQPVSPSQILPGQSGSPAVDKDGRIVSLVSGRKWEGDPGWTSEDRILPKQQTIFTDIPTGFDLRRFD